jgi:lipopolysaccharide assembly protein A
MIILLVLGLLLGGLVVIFTLQNIATVSVVFLAWKFDGSLALILVLAVASGMLLCWLLSLPDVFNKRFQISKLKQHADELEGKLVETKTAVEAEKSKLAATNAYIDDAEKAGKM